jgi:hypothetical protein
MEQKQMNDRNVLKQLEPWEFQYYAFNFNCTEEDLKTALNLVGSCPERLMSQLEK